MFWNSLEKHRDVGLLILRIGVGLGFFFYHGWEKLTGGPERWANVGGVMSRIGIDFGHTFFGFMAAISESLGGVLLAMGLFYQTGLSFHGFYYGDGFYFSLCQRPGKSWQCR